MHIIGRPQAQDTTESQDALRIVAEWRTETENAPAGTDGRDSAAELEFRLEQAGHTLPEVV